jgi:hypothetical protein
MAYIRTKLTTMKLSITFLLFSFFSMTLIAQTPTQTIRGKVVDSESKSPLIGVKVEVKIAPGEQFRALSDVDGNFELVNVPIGKHQVAATFSMYEAKTVTAELSSGKELILNIAMSEMIAKLGEVSIVGRRKGQVLNEMAMLSAQQFSVEETNRYPGSRMDPARMASNFAGVQGSDDSRNDIVIRGNSPLGVVWKMEGIDLPNPSHFAISGSTGGPVSIINNKFLGNSDFFMSAFPAEYGNSTSGVFDLKVRNGNDKRHEFTGQFGFLGTEMMAEGPLNKKGSASYLIMGRYSTLSIFQKIGIQIGTDAVPVYGDASFKFNWKLKNGGDLALFGLGGASNIAIEISKQKEYTKEFYGEGDRDQDFGTAMGIVGLNFKKSLSEKTYITSTIAVSYENQHAEHNYLKRSLDTLSTGAIEIKVDTSYALMAYTFNFNKYSGFMSINHKITKQHLIKAGINVDLITMQQLDSGLVDIGVPNVFKSRWDYNGACVLIQPFIQWKWRISDKMDFTAGVHSQYFSLSNSLSIAEPRLGWKYRMNGNQSIFAGGGMHSQMQPLYTYTYNKYGTQANPIYHNKNMDFMRSLHTGIGYEKFFKKGISIRTEAYYQYLYNVPVTIAPSSFSMINLGSSFSRVFADSLENTGTGVNYGLELTVQKYFDKNFFFLFSGTLYNSEYKGSDGVTRNTSYNGKYVTNLLAGKEFKLGKNNVIGLGVKVTRAGGKKYGYVDVAATNQNYDLTFLDSAFNTRQFRDYFRLDLKISWRLNTAKMTHEIGLDLVNLLGTRNILGLTYAPSLDPAESSAQGYQPTAEKTQLGFLPIFYYKIDFRRAK